MMKVNAVGRFLIATLAAAGGVSSAWAVAFPDPVDGVVTLEVASGSVIYDAALGSVTKLVKTGAGEAVLSVATDAFTGAVEVQGGTLKITHGKALGTTAPISVSDGATFYLYANDYTDQKDQYTDFFAGHEITVCGTGANSQGAFRCGAPNSKMYDRALGTLKLTGDATVQLDRRFGFRTAIYPNGHTLTAVGGNNWMMQNMGTLGKGTIVSEKCTFTLQGTSPKIENPAETRMILKNDQKLTFWSSTPNNLTVTLSNGFLRPDAGTANKLLQPLTIDRNGYVEVPTQRGETLTIGGPIALNSVTGAANLNKRLGGTLYIDGPITTSNGTTSAHLSGIKHTAMGWIVMTTKVDRVIGHYTMHNSNGGPGSKLWLGAGSLFTKGMLRIGNGGDTAGTIWQTGGVYMNSRGDEARIGERGNSFGCYALDGGEVRLSNGVYVAEHANSRGLVKQTGGLFEMAAGTLHLGNRGRGELYVFGGTNDTMRNGSSTLEMSRHASDANPSRSTIVVSGKKSVLATTKLTAGCDTNNNTESVLAFKDGATMIAKRFYRLGGKVYATADNATIMPTVWGGWGNCDYNKDGFATGALTKFAILSGGLTIDMSECYDWERTTKSGGWMPHVFSAPTGKCLSKISLPTDSAFVATNYFGPAMVTIAGKGWGASAYADFDFKAGKLTGITLTSGGCDYDETTTVTLFSPNGKASYACAYELADNAPGGALTKRGAQELILTGNQTYTGGTIVEEGTLTFLNYKDISGVFPSNTPLTVKRGAKINVNNDKNPVLAISSLSGEGTVSCKAATVGEVHVRLSELFGEGHTPLTISSTLTFAEGAKIVVDDPENFEVYKDRKAQKVLKAQSLAGSVSFATPAGVYPSWSVRTSGDSLLFGAQRGFTILVK